MEYMTFNESLAGEGTISVRLGVADMSGMPRFRKCCCGDGPGFP